MFFTLIQFKALFFVALIGLGTLATFYFGNRSAHLPTPPEDAAYRQRELPINVRVEDLLSRMTLEEKVGQMALVDKNSIENIADVSGYGLGGLLSGFGAKPSTNTPEGWRAMVGAFVNESRESRLGIPIFYGVDAIHGHSNVPGATIFPHALGLGAAGDANLVEAVASATAKELLATGVNWTYSPNLDLPRDIRWGRVYETFSDDPELTTKLGAAFVRGTQGSTASGTQTSVQVVSTPKHFIGVGAMRWDSSSNKDFRIDQGMTPADEAALRAEYLPPFAAAVEAGARSIMVGLASWGETKLAAERSLITDLLKDELGFTGFTVSDWYGVYEIPGNDYDAAVTAINAGIDMVMLPYDYQSFIANVSVAVRRGEIPKERLDDAVRRILRVKFEAGLFDRNTAPVSVAVVGAEAHRALARDAVAQSLVLLKNEGVLPIRPSVRHIRVAGNSANNVGHQAGAWTVEWQGVDGNTLQNGTSILAGLRTRAGTDVEISYEAEGNFGSDVRMADLGIAVVGEAPYAEGWGDREFPVLASQDLAVISKLQETSRQVLVILVSGRPLFITNEIDNLDAVVAAWLPGSEGGGVADVLFGDKNFTGTLPLPWPRYSQQLPINVDGKTMDGTEVLFPRYHGLRY